MMTNWDKLKYAPFYLISRIPLSVLYVFSEFLYVLMYYVVRYRRTVVQGNLKIAFPELNQAELINIEKKFYKHFCNLISETIKAISINKNNLLERIKIINPELLSELEGENQSYILYSGHFGNWEWMSSFPLMLKQKVITFYLELSNKYFNDLMICIRSRFGIESVTAHRGFKALSKYKNANVNTFTLFLADQSPHKDTRMHWTNFFKTDTAFNVGISGIAEKLKFAVVFPHFRQTAKGYYEIELIKIWDGKSPLKENEIIDLFAEKLEIAIKESPSLWLWTHRRWKLKKSDYLNNNRYNDAKVTSEL